MRDKKGDGERYNLKCQSDARNKYEKGDHTFGRDVNSSDLYAPLRARTYFLFSTSITY